MPSASPIAKGFLENILAKLSLTTAPIPAYLLLRKLLPAGALIEVLASDLNTLLATFPN